MDKKDKLSILIVSDTHENIDNLNKLVKECEKNLYIPDYIFLLGDIVTINQGEQDNEIKNEKYYKIINELPNLILLFQEIMIQKLYLIMIIKLNLVIHQ